MCVCIGMSRRELGVNLPMCVCRCVRIGMSRREGLTYQCVCVGVCV